MKSYPIEGQEKRQGSIKIDDSTRQISLTYLEYELLNETLNHYIDKGERPPNRESVRGLQQAIVLRWKSQDQDFQPPQWPD